MPSDWPFRVDCRHYSAPADWSYRVTPVSPPLDDGQEHRAAATQPAPTPTPLPSLVRYAANPAIPPGDSDSPIGSLRGPLDERNGAANSWTHEADANLTRPFHRVVGLRTHPRDWPDREECQPLLAAGSASTERLYSLVQSDIWESIEPLPGGAKVGFTRGTG